MQHEQPFTALHPRFIQPNTQARGIGAQSFPSKGHHISDTGTSHAWLLRHMHWYEYSYAARRENPDVHISAGKALAWLTCMPAQRCASSRSGRRRSNTRSTSDYTFGQTTWWMIVKRSHETATNSWRGDGLHSETKAVMAASATSHYQHAHVHQARLRCAAALGKLQCVCAGKHTMRLQDVRLLHACASQRIAAADLLTATMNLEQTGLSGHMCQCIGHIASRVMCTIGIRRSARVTWSCCC